MCLADAGRTSSARGDKQKIVFAPGLGATICGLCHGEMASWAAIRTSESYGVCMRPRHTPVQYQPQRFAPVTKGRQAGSRGPRRRGGRRATNTCPSNTAFTDRHRLLPFFVPSVPFPPPPTRAAQTHIESSPRSRTAPHPGLLRNRRDREMPPSAFGGGSAVSQYHRLPEVGS